MWLCQTWKVHIDKLYNCGQQYGCIGMDNVIYFRNEKKKIMSIFFKQYSSTKLHQLLSAQLIIILTKLLMQLDSTIKAII